MIQLSRFAPLCCRYVAVHNPLDYKQAMNDSDAIRRRLLKYLLPVIVSGVAFNVPRFFESTFNFVTVEVSVLPYCSI